jgi:hypothetical protein
MGPDVRSETERNNVPEQESAVPEVAHRLLGAFDVAAQEVWKRRWSPPSRVPYHHVGRNPPTFFVGSSSRAYNRYAQLVEATDRLGHVDGDFLIRQFDELVRLFDAHISGAASVIGAGIGIEGSYTYICITTDEPYEPGG